MVNQESKVRRRNGAVSLIARDRQGEYLVYFPTRSIVGLNIYVTWSKQAYRRRIKQSLTI